MVSRPAQMVERFDHFQFPKPCGKPKHVYSTGGTGQAIPESIVAVFSLVGSHLVRLLAHAVAAAYYIRKRSANVL